MVKNWKEQGVTLHVEVAGASNDTKGSPLLFDSEVEQQLEVTTAHLVEEIRLEIEPIFLSISVLTCRTDIIVFQSSAPFL